MLSWLLLGGLIVVLPMLCGLLPVNWMMPAHKNPIMVYIAGWFVLFSLFQLIAIPFIVLQISFSKLVLVFNILLPVYLVCSVLFGRKGWRDSTKRLGNGIKEINIWEWIAWGVIIVLVILQMVYLYTHQFFDGDDSYYISVANDCLTFNSMYLRDAYTGYLLFTVEIRHAISPVPVFMAWLASNTGISPTVIAHGVMGPLFVAMSYMIYALLGKHLLRHKRHLVPLFVLLLMAWYVFGNVSRYTAETFAYTRTWQGKSMFANLVIPLLYVSILYILEEKRARGEWFLLGMTVVVATFTTSIAVFLVPVILTLFMMFGYYKLRDKRVVIGTLICMIPCVLFGVVYILSSTYVIKAFLDKF